LHAATIPNCKAYDPAFAGEMAVIIDQGVREMMVEQQDVFYYVTLMNENYAQPTLPEGVREDIIRGAYLFEVYQAQNETAQATLLGSGAILTEVIKAAQQLSAEGITTSVYSVTSWSELARDGLACEQAALSGDPAAGVPFIYQQLSKSQGPIIAVTDYVRAVPETIRAYVPSRRRLMTLGTDGFGRRDPRAALRTFFGVDAQTIVRATKYALT
jgi:pyruvate dehydrogenase E1 component